jgi:hypothetical protein
MSIILHLPQNLSKEIIFKYISFFKKNRFLFPVPWPDNDQQYPVQLARS